MTKTGKKSTSNACCSEIWSRTARNNVVNNSLRMKLHFWLISTWKKSTMNKSSLLNVLMSLLCGGKIIQMLTSSKWKANSNSTIAPNSHNFSVYKSADHFNHRKCYFAPSAASGLTGCAARCYFVSALRYVRLYCHVTRLCCICSSACGRLYFISSYGLWLGLVLVPSVL